MTVIELPDDLAAALKAKAAAQDLKLEDWFRTLTDAPASGGNDLDRVFAEIRGLADDIDFSRDTATSRPVDL
jgi:plasmid stability protein